MQLSTTVPQATWSEFGVDPMLSGRLDQRFPKVPSGLSGSKKNLKFCSSVYIFSLMFLYVKMLLTSGPFEHSLTPNVINLFFFDIHH